MCCRPDYPHSVLEYLGQSGFKLARKILFIPLDSTLPSKTSDFALLLYRVVFSAGDMHAASHGNHGTAACPFGDSRPQEGRTANQSIDIMNHDCFCYSLALRTHLAKSTLESPRFSRSFLWHAGAPSSGT